MSLESCLGAVVDSMSVEWAYGLIEADQEFWGRVREPVVDSAVGGTSGLLLGLEYDEFRSSAASILECYEYASHQDRAEMRGCSRLAYREGLS